MQISTSRILLCLTAASILFIISSCSKAIDEDTSWIKSSVCPDIPLRDVAFSDNNWYACGGVKNSNGGIFRSADYGKSWTTLRLNLNHSFNALGFLDNSVGWAAGDSLYMERSFSDGSFWNFYWLADNVPPNEFDRTSFKGMQIFQDSMMAFAGGDGYAKGLFYISKDRGMHWYFKTFDREMSDVFFFNENEGLICGNGAIMHTVDGGLNFNYVTPSHDFFTGLDFANSGLGFCCSYDANVYTTNDYGKNWEVLLKMNSVLCKNYHFNDISTDESGNWVAVGDDGIVVFSDKTGKDRKMVVISEKPRLLRVKRYLNEVLITSANGCLYHKVL
ncbi:MAG: hypothetical protein Q7J34_10965 [Bacteroidales bacterium]|nr:hypothetical protein [Bacteroidales bacterium]